MKETKFNYLFENEDIVVIEKQSGIAVFNCEDENTPSHNSILDVLQNKYGSQILPVNSLHYQASGLVVFAKTKKAHKSLSEQFKNEKILKTYHIIVNGVIDEPEGKIEKKLLVSSDTTAVSESGIESVTEYKVLEQFKSFAFVEVVPRTTRRNQIRAHFWSLGNPLAIDETYGSQEPILLSGLKKRYKGISEEKPLLARLPLHLSKIEFTVPGDKTKSTFISELPKDMALTVKQLKKYNKRGLYV